MELRTGRHCVFLMHAHLIFITKYRGRVFSAEILDNMENIMNDVCGQFEVEINEFNGEQDHVHLLISFPPKVCLSKLINSLKGVSSRRLRQKYPQIKRYKSLWSPSYFAGSVGGAPIEILRQYIEQQNKPH
jgi:putative transposase